MKLTKNADPNKYVYSGYDIGFDVVSYFHGRTLKEVKILLLFIHLLRIYSDEREGIFKEISCCLTTISILTIRFLN